LWQIKNGRGGRKPISNPGGEVAIRTSAGEPLSRLSLFGKNVKITEGRRRGVDGRARRKFNCTFWFVHDLARRNRQGLVEAN